VIEALSKTSLVVDVWIEYKYKDRKKKLKSVLKRLLKDLCAFEIRVSKQ